MEPGFRLSRSVGRRRHFSDGEIAELAMMIGQYLAFVRLLVIAGGHKAAREIYVPEY